MKSKSSSRNRSVQANKLRVIGGEWRGRKLVFPPLPGIRPTPDRVRETVFNWLQSDVVGARCLDLFAGSGALGIEALSRGAAYVAFVDREPQIAAYLRATLDRLHCTRADIVTDDAQRWLSQSVQSQSVQSVQSVQSRSAQPFDIVFLDPPFAQGMLPAISEALERRGWLAPRALIYLECAAAEMPTLPPAWQLIKSKTAGQVGYHLARRVGGHDERLDDGRQGDQRQDRERE